MNNLLRRTPAILSFTRAVRSPTELVFFVSVRTISTTNSCFGKTNFRKFPIPNKRGIFEHHKLPKPFLDVEYKDRIVYIDDMKIRYPGFYFGKKFVYVKEMEPDIIVPVDFENSPLKPYVSYRTEDVYQSEFTPEQLFSATYGKDIITKYRKGEAIPDEYLEYDSKAVEDAKKRALKVNADLFSHTSYFGSLGKIWRYGHSDPKFD